MAQPFALRHFLRHLDKDLLSAYLTQNSIKLELSPKDPSEPEAEEAFEALQQLAPEVRAPLEHDFQEINELASEKGLQEILDEARWESLGLTEQLEAIAGKHNKALWTFLNYPEIFREAALWHEVDSLGGWKEMTGLELPSALTPEQIEGLEAALSRQYLTEEGRGRYCSVEPYSRADRICLHALLDDYADIEPEFTEGKLRRRVRRPAFEVFFLLFPEEGRLKIKARGGWKKVEALQGVFSEAVLQRELSPFDRRPVYNLEGLKRRGFPFVTEPADGVEYVKVKALRFKVPGTSRRITVEADGSRGDELYDVLEGLKMPVDVEANQARLAIKFPGRGKRGSVTFQITSPDSCSLGDSELHLKTRQYLKRWGIDRG